MSKMLDIVIPSGDRPDCLHKTLVALRQAHCDEYVHQIVVVGVPNDDATRAVIRNQDEYSVALKYEIVPQHSENAAAARNHGLAVCESDQILFLDNDVLVSPDFFRSLSDHACVAGSALVIPRVDEIHSSSTPSVVPDVRLSWLEEESTKRWPWRLVWTCALLVPRRIAAMRFSEIFVGWGAEDVEFGFRAVRAGAAIRYCQSCITHHIVGPRPRNPYRGKTDRNSRAFLPYLFNVCRCILEHCHDEDLIAYYVNVELPWFRVTKMGVLLQDQPRSDGWIVLMHILRLFAELNHGIQDYSRKTRELTRRIKASESGASSAGSS